MHPDAPYVVSLLSLTPDNFTRQRESAATQWVNIVDEHAKMILDCGSSFLHLLDDIATKDCFRAV
jgi:DeoR/GlpR family transcriptional regulator of sugar metabolism